MAHDTADLPVTYQRQHLRTMGILRMVVGELFDNNAGLEPGNERENDHLVEKAGPGHGHRAQMSTDLIRNDLVDGHWRSLRFLRTTSRREALTRAI